MLNRESNLPRPPSAWLLRIALTCLLMLALAPTTAAQPGRPPGLPRPPAGGPPSTGAPLSPAPPAPAAPDAPAAPTVDPPDPPDPPEPPPAPAADDSKAKARTAREERKEREKAYANLHAERVKELMRIATTLRTTCSSTAQDIAAAQVEARSDAAECAEVKKACKPGNPRCEAELAECAKEAQRLTKFQTQTAALKTKGGLCSSFCDPQAGVGVNLCAFEDPVAANAAVLADWTDARILMRYIETHLANLNALRPKGSPASAPSIPGPAALPEVLGGSTGIAGEVTTAALNFATVGLTALAKLIEDRAKREGIGWFLERVGRDLCGLDAAIPQSPNVLEQIVDEPNNGLAEAERTQAKQIVAKLNAATKKRAEGEAQVVYREMRTFWFPALCSLAGKTNDLTQYGGGGKLFEALRGAVASDVTGWPGAAAGLGLGYAFWSGIVPQNQPKNNPFLCTPDDTTGACASVLQIRRAGATFVEQMLSGQSPTASLFALSGRLDTANLDTSPPANPRLHVDGFQVAACAAAMPYYFDEHGDLLPTYDPAAKQANAGKNDSAALAEASLDRTQKTEALLVAAFASAPACWSIVGKGVEVSGCEALGGKKNGDACGEDQGDWKRALGNSAPIERLSTVLRLTHRFATGARVVEAQWRKLLQAASAYEDAARASMGAIGRTPDVPIDIGSLLKGADEKSLPEVIRAAQDLVEKQARTLQQGPVVKQLQAALAVAQAAIELASVSIGAVEGAIDPVLYPGLCTASGCPSLSQLSLSLGKARETLNALAKDVSTLSGVLAEDWGSTVASAVGSLRLHIEVICHDAATKNKQSGACGDVMPKISRYMSLVVTLVAEKDPERMAETLDSLAAPVGGWRSKSNANVTVVSLAAFPGFAAGGEVRFGQYGVTRERGKVYSSAPTLTLPVGVDVAFGTDCSFPAPFGLFFSVLDPAAFLQYDASEQGRLPGPRLTTALSPGVWMRFGFKDTPVSLNLFGVYRPGLRAWEASVSGPAADAFQFGASASVDVTLFDLYTKQR
ncbi:hypothetical protein ACSRUE_27515 [Sorangium sp. KYC3313]|uniref:hypothetical protein n=1 Tax=Sorangium sp. KYC3313 TaxID=3449740 RepID=UPI003F896F50